MEPLILYFVLFFPGVISFARNGTAVMPETIPFYPTGELLRAATYTVPALALIWYVIIYKKSINGKFSLRPGLDDLRSFFLGFPSLILTGVVLSFIMAIASASPPPKVEAPGSAFAWGVMIVSCAGTGYLEESFFRFYLLRKMKEWAAARWVRIAVSVMLFALCHLYEGPWGILNAAIAGLILAVIFEHYMSIHGIAFAHAAYNAFVYFAGTFG